MSAAAVETLLAALYTDPALRQRFCHAPADVCEAHGLTAAETAAMLRIDQVGLGFAARSIEYKRRALESSDARGGRLAPGSVWWRRFCRALRCALAVTPAAVRTPYLPGRARASDADRHPGAHRRPHWPG